MQTKEQKRAAYALDQVTKLWHGKFPKEAANLIVGTPTMILQNGVFQTLAFYLSKPKSDQHKLVYQFLRDWLREGESGLAAHIKPGTDLDFLTSFAELEQSLYLQAQEESLKVLQWLKRYARAFEVQGGSDATSKGK